LPNLLVNKQRKYQLVSAEFSVIHPIFLPPMIEHI
jgi:hypothetical protein